MGGEVEPNNHHDSVFTRVWKDYSVIRTTATVAESYYNSLKSYNSYSRSAFETAESYAKPVVSASWAILDTYTQNPLVEGVLNRADEFGHTQLDKIEDGLQKIKATAPNTIRTLENALHGTKVEGALIRTATTLDYVVDALFPDESNDDSDKASSSVEGASLVEVTTPLYYKLKSRVSKKSVLELPAHTYTGLKTLTIRRAEAFPQVNQSIVLLQGVSSYLLSLQQKVEMSNIGVESVYKSWDIVAHSVASVVSILQQFDPVEVRATAKQLSRMIKASKENLTTFVDKFHITQQLKVDSASFLLRASNILSGPLDAGYAHISKSDIPVIKQIFATLESALHGIIESFSVQAEQSDKQE